MIAIKEIEMPSCCGECNLTACKGKDEPWNYCCSITLTDINLDNTERPSDCPLVEIEERKVGKWIYDKTSQNWRCSKCNETPKTLGYVGTSAFMTEHFKFCNHCGAKMRGAENG